MDWISAKEKPESGKPVIATYQNSYGKKRTIIAFYAERFTIESGSDCDDGVDEYSEEKDEYYLLPGWYEQIDNWGDYAFVAVVEGDVALWLPLDALPVPSFDKTTTKPK